MTLNIYLNIVKVVAQICKFNSNEIAILTPSTDDFYNV